MGARDVARRAGGFGLVILGLACLGARADGATPRGNPAEGQELFAREWLPGDPRGHGGDGLGPVYNDTSCVACHNLGGPGGGGPASKNADIISAFSTPRIPVPTGPQERGFLSKAVEALVGIDAPKAPPTLVSTPAKPRPPRTDELIKLHAGFRTARSLVLHRFGTEPGYEAWRLQMSGLGQNFLNNFEPTTGAARNGLVEQEQIKSLVRLNGPNALQGQTTRAGEFFVVRSQRNPTALFGAGQIDSVSDAVLEDAARATFPEYPEVKGRVARQKDGRIGRFGWKDQTPSLDDFVRTACAVELGLESPRHHQAGLPTAPDRTASGLDLTDQECDSLVAYIRDLPPPTRHTPSSPKEAEALAAGEATFASVGCATCHTPRLGQVEGIYSDLLLHDMGPDLGDVGQYGVFDPKSAEPEPLDPNDTVTEANPAAGPVQPTTDRLPAFGASRLEWRTPPLWGLRDSGPYLHDGRAETIDQAIALHGGQAATAARHYFALPYQERQRLQAFLKSLVAPTEQLARDGE